MTGTPLKGSEYGPEDLAIIGAPVEKSLNQVEGDGLAMHKHSQFAMQSAKATQDKQGEVLTNDYD